MSNSFLSAPSPGDAPGSSLASAPCSASHFTDERLIEMIRRREPHGLEILHRRYATLLRRLALDILHNDTDADDVLQEIFLEIWRRAESCNPDKGRPLGWMITLSRRRALDRRRRREAYGRMEARFTREFQSCSDEFVVHVEEEVGRADMRAHIGRVLAMLPAAQREVIDLTFFKGMIQREIASYTGVPLGTVKTRLALGLSKLSAVLADPGDCF